MRIRCKLLTSCTLCFRAVLFCIISYLSLISSIHHHSSPHVGCIQSIQHTNEVETASALYSAILSAVESLLREQHFSWITSASITIHRITSRPSTLPLFFYYLHRGFLSYCSFLFLFVFDLISLLNEVCTIHNIHCILWSISSSLYSLSYSDKFFLKKMPARGIEQHAHY